MFLNTLENVCLDPHFLLCFPNSKGQAEVPKGGRFARTETRNSKMVPPESSYWLHEKYTEVTITSGRFAVLPKLFWL